MHLHVTNKDVQAIVQISIDPRFEIRDFLNELRNEWTILGKHESFHQIHHDIIIPLFQKIQQISKTFANNFMCVPNYKKPQLNFFKNFVSKERNSTGDDSCYVSHNCPSKEATSLVMVSHPQFCLHVLIHLNNKNFPTKFVKRMCLGFKLQQNLKLPNLLLFKVTKETQKQPNREIRIIGPKLIRILNKSFIPMSMNNNSSQCHWQLPQLGHHFVFHLKLRQSYFRMVHLIMNYT